MKRIIPFFALAFFPWPEFMKSQIADIQDGEVVEAWFSASCEGDPPKKELIHLEVAKTEMYQRKGLSNRKEQLKQDAGMLFVFQPRRIGRIWMKDTLIPLQLVHIHPDGQVMEIQEMLVEKDPSTPSRIYQAWPEVDAVLELRPGRLKESQKGLKFCVRKREKRK
jgi:uncharacterized membrane protein (UPF0127 family)